MAAAEGQSEERGKDVMRMRSCFLLALGTSMLLLPAAASAQSDFAEASAVRPAFAQASTDTLGPAAERLSLETAVRLAVENNRQLQTTRLQVEKADADLATARTRRLPRFSTELSASQLLSPVDFAFPKGAFGIRSSRSRRSSTT